MSLFKPVAALLALLTMPMISLAADDAATLRAELQALKTGYDARIARLEARLRQLESGSSISVDGAVTASNASATATASVPPEPPPGSLPPAGSGGNAAFNPSLSVVLGGAYTQARRDPADWAIAGFTPAGDELGPGDRSFNLGESELTLAASVDPYFSAQLTAAITGDDEVEVEEAFVRTSALPDGFTAKLGRFFSGLGYLNEVHAHAWDFADQPLVYQAMFGGQYTQNGVQLKWLAPSEIFLELGAETGSGDSFPGTRREGNGVNGATLFAHVGGDAGDYASWRAGASWQRTEASARGLVTPFDGFDGDARTWGVDAVYKWAPSPRQGIKLQAEYLRREERGRAMFDPEGVAVPVTYDGTQEGWYVQGVWQFAARWRAGARYDRLDSGRGDYLPVGLPGVDIDFDSRARNPRRLSLMFDWNPSEFTRLRAQYDLDEARDDGERDRILRLQYLFGIGAHGAHKY